MRFYATKLHLFLILGAHFLLYQQHFYKNPANSCYQICIFTTFGNTQHLENHTIAPKSLNLFKIFVTKKDYFKILVALFVKKAIVTLPKSNSSNCKTCVNRKLLQIVFPQRINGCKGHMHLLRNEIQ